MTYSFEHFNLGLHKLAFWSSADLERVGMLDELTNSETTTAREFSALTNRHEMIESVVQIDIS
jgi:hypothetical protein